MYSAEYHREYYQRNKEKKRAQGIAWAKANPEKVRASARATSKKRRELGKDVAIRKAWESRNREYILWNAAKQRARKLGLEFSIDIADVVIPSVCPFLEIPITLEATGRMNPNSPSLDRIDNSRGYVKGNVQVISWKANRIKCDSSLAELKTFAENTLRWLGRE